MDELVDLCPKCGKEVFQYILKYKCVEPTCAWTGNDPHIEKRETYERR